MVSVLLSNVASRLAEQRVLLCNLNWQSYEQILAAVGERRSAQLTYFDGWEKQLLSVNCVIASTNETFLVVIKVFEFALQNRGSFQGKP